MITLSDLSTPMTPAEVRASVYQTLSTLGLPASSWKPAAVTRTFIAGSSIVMSALTHLIAAIAASGWLELAEKDWLTLVAHYVYGIERREATFASGVVTLVNSGGGVFFLDAGELVLLGSNGKAYRNTASISLGASQTLTDVPIAALEPGSASTAGPNTIAGFETTLLGVTATNPAALVGRDAETDAALRVRCTESIGALSPGGPKDAYAAAARNAVLDGSPIDVTRIRTQHDTFGTVRIYVAKPSGALTAAELAAVAAAIDDKATPIAVTAIALNATPLPITIEYEVWAKGGESQLQAAIDAKLAEFMGSQPIGGIVVNADPGKVFVDAIEAAIASASSAIFHVVALANGSSDFVLVTPTEVPVLDGSPIATLHVQASV